MVTLLKLFGLLCLVAFGLSACATADTKLGLTTNEGPRIPETPDH